MESKKIYLLGVPDDRGVKLNHGRVGAKLGPKKFREYFHRLVVSDATRRMVDLGDLSIDSRSIEKTHECLAEKVKDIHKKNADALVIIMGGGHDHAYGEISGLIRARPDKKIGICNIDAHLDMRPVVKGKITSGTPFWRLWQKHEAHIGYHVTFGVRESCVEKAHLEYAQKRRTHVVFSHEMMSEQSQAERLMKELEVLFSATDRVSLNIDLDAFMAHMVPGVSAPSPLGLNPMAMMHVLEKYVANPFLKTLGIYELNPRVDVADMSSRFVAELVYRLIKAR